MRQQEHEEVGNFAMYMAWQSEVEVEALTEHHVVYPL